MSEMPVLRLRHRDDSPAAERRPAPVPPNQRPARRRWSPELTAALIVIVGGAAVITVLRLAPGPVHTALSGALVGTVVVVLVLFRALWNRQHTPAHGVRHPAPPRAGPEGWFETEALEGFPLQELRPLLDAPDAPDLEQLHTAWILLDHGRDAAWVSHHLDLLPDCVRLLADAAHRRHA
ncbi:hypothetical protein [Streptomyces sp. NPDC093707]|uniref:hypothetical protein n=1 Tax=Streptomyces sp. NPDC093707 TaxID=3154984 RepID=UPI00344CBD4A